MVSQRAAATMSQRIVIAGGGTGGHVYPALAIGEALRELSSNIEIVFVGTSSGFESKALRDAGEQFIEISAGGLVGKSPIARARGAWKASVGVLQCLALLRRLKPEAVIGSGGYVMAPVVWAAQLLGLPTFLQEQNSYPGLTTRKLARKAKAVFLGFGSAAQFLPGATTIESGNPLRTKLIENSRSVRNSSGSPHLLIVGGSQGAQSINRAIAESLADIAKVTPVTWQFGKSGLPDNIDLNVFQTLTSSGRLTAEPFFSDMHNRYAEATLVLCRAGAMTLAEIALYGLPAVLVPFPHAAHDHQTANAMRFVEQKAARMIPDSELSRNEILTNVLPLLTDSATLETMSAASRSLARPHAANNIAAHILNSLHH
jgi:UDP-N-acetylglucosamine--N-acetylmuramyl-(pentapeptide) pyrophosphoryl-undecaprenol N-acetylglucosamine transferase